MPIPNFNDSPFSPRNLLVIDGLGALLSAFLLGIVLVHYEALFGMPKNSLYVLASLPCVFVTYDLVAYFQPPKRWAKFLKGIAWANLLYCGLSLGFALYHAQQLTTLGWLYFLGEMLIVTALAMLELKVAGKQER